MNTIYNECLGNAELTYSAFCEKDEETRQDVYSISVRNNISKTETIIRNFTSKKEQAIDFVETLVRNIVLPEFVGDIAQDYVQAY